MSKKQYYKTLIFDVDGVLLDSNEIKKNNIQFCAEPYLDDLSLSNFIKKWTDNNGIPREEKIYNQFGYKSDTSLEILNNYNNLNEKTLKEVEVIFGVHKILKNLSKSYTLFAVSGGLESEVQSILEEKKLKKYFENIYGGPISKKINIEKNIDTHKCLYVGDSKHDFEVAEYFKMDFVFVYKYTQFKNWKKFFKTKENVSLLETINKLKINN